MMYGRMDVLQVLEMLIKARENKQPLSLIRLGDGEGRLLGYPDITTKSELDKSLKIWFSKTTFNTKDLIVISKQLRTSVRTADIIGIPRPKQQKRHEYQSVIYAIKRFNLIQKKQAITDSAIHRYLQFGLFYRNLLSNINYCGLITCRNIADKIQTVFNIEQVVQYLIPGEMMYPGEYDGTHFPDRFYELKENLIVPFKGAIFLVGAGCLR